jgi:hypothetical protein
MFLGLAFFVKYSFEHFITPEMRVAIGFIAGAGLLAGGFVMSRRNYAVLGHTLSATGIVVLYVSTFAAHGFYHFVGFAPAFALMILITCTAFLLAVRQDAQVVAVLGLLGGFLTPILLSTGRDNPLGLFGYIALLDAGLVTIVRRKPWTHLVLLAAIGTLGMQCAWVIKFFAIEKAYTAMGIFLSMEALFLAAFVLIQKRDEEDIHVTRAAFLEALAPLVFAFCLLVFPALGRQPWMIFTFVLLADLGSSHWRYATAAFSCLPYQWLYVFPVAHPLDPLLPYQPLAELGFGLVSGFCGSALPFPAHPGTLSPWGHDRPLGVAFPWPGFWARLAVNFAAARDSLYRMAARLLAQRFGIRTDADDGFYPDLAGRSGPDHCGHGPLGLTPAGSLSRTADTAHSNWRFRLAVFCRRGHSHAASESPGSAEGEMVRGFLSSGAGSLGSSSRPFRSVAFPALGDGGLPSTPGQSIAGIRPGLAPDHPFTWSGAHYRHGSALCHALACILMLEYVWHLVRYNPGFALVPLIWYLAFYAVFTGFPFLFRQAFAHRVLPWAVAALAGPLQFGLIYRIADTAYKNQFMGLLPAAFALPSLAGLFWLLRHFQTSDEIRNRVLAWWGGAGLFFITLIFPINLRKNGLPSAGLWKAWRCGCFTGCRTRDCAWWGGAPGVAFVRLALNPAVLTYHRRAAYLSSTGISNAYGVTAVCLLAGGSCAAASPHQNVNVLPWLQGMGTVLAFATQYRNCRLFLHQSDDAHPSSFWELCP